MALLTTNNPFMLGFDSLERMLDRAAKNSESYPPYNIEQIDQAEKDATAASFMVGTTEYAIPLNDKINVEEEIAKMEEKIRYFEGFLAGVMKKLNNERFVANAKPEIVELERKKKADAESKIETLKASIAALKK